MTTEMSAAEIVQEAIDICRKWKACTVEQSDLDVVSHAVRYLVSQLPQKKRDRLLPSQPKKVGRPKEPDAWPLACRMRDELDKGTRWTDARKKLNTYYRVRQNQILTMSDSTLRRKVKALREGKLGKPALWQKSKKT